MEIVHHNDEDRVRFDWRQYDEGGQAGPRMVTAMKLFCEAKYAGRKAAINTQA